MHNHSTQCAQTERQDANNLVYGNALVVKKSVRVFPNELCVSSFSTSIRSGFKKKEEKNITGGE